MNNINLLKGLRKIAVLGVATLVLSACLNSNKDPEITPVAGVAFYDASTVGAGHALFVGNTGISTIKPGQASLYIPLTVANHTFSVTDYTRKKVLYQKQHLLDEGKFYSMFIADRPEQKDSIDVLFKHDDLPVYSETKAKVRFVQLSPQGKLTLTVNNQDLFMDQPFKSITDFIDVDAGAATFSVKKQSGGDAIAKGEGITLVAKNYYTVFVGGYEGETGDKEMRVKVNVALLQQ